MMTLLVLAKSLYISRTARHFYGTEIENWAAFGQVGHTSPVHLDLKMY